MAGSYKKVDYTLRPAKYIERKMLSEAFRRLLPFGSVEGYRYIGFGSLYFSDFKLFHRELGICDMVSIECMDSDAPRFEFNRPFGCIAMEYGWSNEVLPRLSWNSRTILWLDYDDPLDQRVLTDVGFFCSNALAGSMLIVTVNVSGKPKTSNEDTTPEVAKDRDQTRLQLLKHRVGDANVPAELKENDLAAWGLADVVRRIISNKIDEVLLDINGARTSASQIAYHQLFNFRYRDGARMLTVGGIVCEKSQSAIFEGCGFDQLPYYRPESEAYEIEVPHLTHKELRYLDTNFPVRPGVDIDAEGIPEAELSKYSMVYRYFPTFAAADI